MDTIRFEWIWMSIRRQLKHTFYLWFVISIFVLDISMMSSYIKSHIFWSFHLYNPMVEFFQQNKNKIYWAIYFNNKSILDDLWVCKISDKGRFLFCLGYFSHSPIPHKPVPRVHLGKVQRDGTEIKITHLLTNLMMTNRLIKLLGSVFWFCMNKNHVAANFSLPLAKLFFLEGLGQNPNRL